MPYFRNPFPICYDESFPQFRGLVPPTRFGCVPVSVYGWPEMVPAAPSSGVKMGVKLRSISKDGLWFIFAHEAQAKVTNHLHWPGGASGVTLGPGYDMKARRAADVTADMKAIGLSDAVATVVSQAASLKADEARKFAQDHRNTVDLTDDQQVQLLKRVVKSYEGVVRKSIKINLTQNEFDALVSFAYNPAGRWHSVTHLLNRGDVHAAMLKIKSGNTSGGKVMRGLTNRRADEVKLYLDGKYQFNGRTVAPH